MNANQIVNMVVRMVMNRLLRSGVNAGINAMGNLRAKGKTPEEMGKSPDTREATKRMQKSVRLSRRIGRF